MSHQRHGWAKASTLDENNNRYQPGAPLVVWCGRCKTLVPADEEWAKLAAGGVASEEEILLAKVRRWAGRSVAITSIGRNLRGRLEITYEAPGGAE